VSFAVAPDAYDRFMGRYSNPLARLFADFGEVAGGQRVLDVGAGPGALTSELVSRVGAANVTAVEPSSSFVDALGERYPEVNSLHASAESLPFEDASFDAVLAQLVVNFMADPVQGLREMARVAGEDAVVSASVWDHGGGRGPLSPYWDVVREFDPEASGESELPGATEGHLTELFEAAGLRGVDEVALTVHVTHETFEEWWEPYTLGVGPAGAYASSLDNEQREELRALAAAKLRAPFTIEARAWAARARA
jgi:SAM-dependent methyltransferase